MVPDAKTTPTGRGRTEGDTGEAAAARRRVNIVLACAMACVSRRTIYRWMHDGKIEYVRTAGGSVRIYADTLFREPEAE